MTLTLSTCAAASLSMPMTLTLSTCAAASLSLYSRCGSLVKRTTSHSPSVRAGCGSARMCGLCCLRESVWSRPLGILLSAICKCIVEPVSWSSSEVLLLARERLVAPLGHLVERNLQVHSGAGLVVEQ